VAVSAPAACWLPSGHCCSTRVRYRMVNRIRGRCLTHRSKTRLALSKLLPANSSSVTRSPSRDHLPCRSCGGPRSAARRFLRQTNCPLRFGRDLTCGDRYLPGFAEGARTPPHGSTHLSLFGRRFAIRRSFLFSYVICMSGLHRPEVDRSRYQPTQMSDQFGREFKGQNDQVRITGQSRRTGRQGQPRQKWAFSSRKRKAFSNANRRVDLISDGRRNLETRRARSGVLIEKSRSRLFHGSDFATSIGSTFRCQYPILKFIFEQRTGAKSLRLSRCRQGHCR
jgi:hypothetical protein